MNTNLTAHDITTSTISPATKSVRHSKIRRLVATLLLAFTAATAITVATDGAPVGAAGNATVSVCVKTNAVWNGTVFPGAYKNYPVFIDAHLNGQWVHQASYKTDNNGCIKVNLAPALQRYYWRFSVQYYSGGVWYAGGSNHANVNGPYLYNLGTFWV